MSQEQPPSGSSGQPTRAWVLLLRTLLAGGAILAGGIGIVWYATK